MAGDVLVGMGQAKPGGHVAPKKQGSQWAAPSGCHILGTRVPGGHTGVGCHHTPGGSAAGTPCPGDMVPWRTHGHSTHNTITTLWAVSWGCPILETRLPRATWSPGGATSCIFPEPHTWLHRGRVSEESPMFLSSHSRYSGDQGDPPGEELTGLRALP